MRLVLFHKSGEEVKEGEFIESFRGELHKFIQITQRGKIYTERNQHNQEFYPSVFPNTEIKEVE